MKSARRGSTWADDQQVDIGRRGAGGLRRLRLSLVIWIRLQGRARGGRGADLTVSADDAGHLQFILCRGGFRRGLLGGAWQKSL